MADPTEKLKQTDIPVSVLPSGGMGLALTADGKVPAPVLAEPWLYPADLGLYLNTWADAGSGILRVRFRRVAGIVFFEGQPTKAVKPAAELILGPLPVGYYPQNSIHFLVPDPSAAFGQGTELSVSSAGVRFEGSAAPGGGAVAPHLVFSFTPYPA